MYISSLYMSVLQLLVIILMMGSKIILFAFTVLFCKVQSQFCGCSSPTPVSTQIISPQVVSPPVVATTIVDNSVSNALANALQLLIVSDLIESTLSPALANSNVLNSLTSIIENIQTPCGSALEVISRVPCGQNVEVIKPCGPSILETIQPNVFGGYTETFSPIYGPSAQFIEKIQPNSCGGITETFSPCRNGPVIEKIQPNFYGGITETFSPICGNGPIVEKIQPNIFGGITETLTSLYGPQMVEQFIPNSFGFTETIGPNFCGVNEFVNPGFYNGVTEIVSPPCSLPSPVTPSFYERVTEIVQPTAQFIPNYYGGVTEVVTPPMAAEVLFPSSIPAQLTCNFGYNIPTNTPCVNVNVETLPFEPCGCNSFSKNYHY